MRLLIPDYARKEALNALVSYKRNKKRYFGFGYKRASKLRIKAGVNRAKQLVNQKFIGWKDVKAIAVYYQRFKKCRTAQCHLAISLWGGKKFGRRLVKFIKEVNKINKNVKTSD